ncbi:FkbM family methyltransferase [Pseudodesulfovibrio sp.]|uniref:FkbM family methyltransferase n=1 Tax=Pseudodesulfovibrio sp. TaxID=2035812 RepID=UPI00260BC3E2|nr:FkbM family methyltransferase [Pseudodesulfovibrio sp.]MDD3312819.1 FkbM family methyltransferase [Pseudodesulfovibrio sp.]
MRIQDLYREVEADLLARCPEQRYPSKAGAVWRWASRRRGSLWKRLAFVLDRRMYKEWDRAEGTFGLGVVDEFWSLVNNAAAYEAAFDRLEDEPSREVFLWRLKLRLALPFVLRWEDVYPAPEPPGVGDLSIGAEEEAFCKGFRSGQYLLRGICMPEPGDVVLDVGAFLGDSAVTFSRLVGEGGRVYSIEALADQFAALRRNLDRFGCANTTPCFNAAWNRNEELCISSNRGSSCIGGGDNPVPGVRLDDFVAEHNIERVDFIKMDIEGAEQEAIEGGAETIRRFRPKLALSAYHKPEDLYRLMDMVAGLHPGYRFWMRHYDPHGMNDTVLYAVG